MLKWDSAFENKAFDCMGLCFTVKGLRSTTVVLSSSSAKMWSVGVRILLANKRLLVPQRDVVTLDAMADTDIEPDAITNGIAAIQQFESEGCGSGRGEGLSRRIFT